MPTPSLALPNDFDLRQQVSHFDEYFGVWSIYEQPFRAAVERVRGIDIRAHIIEAKQTAEPLATSGATNYPVTAGGVALVSLTGPLMKYQSSLSAGSSTVAFRRQIRLAAQDSEVAAILIRVDSPGGTVSGTADAAEEVAKAAAKKPTFAYIEDLGCSAAYWIASQCTKVFCNPTAIVGSIGTFAVLYDSHRMYESAGVDVHVIRAGDMKGAGADGTAVTVEQLAEWQSTVDALNAHFLKAVSTGRGLSMAKVKDLADGRVHIGAAAQPLGLVDGVQSIEQTLEMVGKKSRGGPKAEAAEIVSEETKEPVSTGSDSIPASSDAQPEGKEVMSTEAKPAAENLATVQGAPITASYADIVAACPGADSDFICKQLAAKATTPEATKAWMVEQNARITAANEKTAKAEADAKAAADQAKAAAKIPGVDPIGTSGKAAAGEGTGDAIADWNALVESKMTGSRSKAQAVSMASKENPELHKAMLVAHNQDKGRKKAVANLIAG